VLDSGENSVSTTDTQSHSPHSVRSFTSRASLVPHHRANLKASGISDEVIDRRGYATLMRTDTDLRPRDRLRNAGFSKTLWDTPQRFPGLYIPLHGPNGQVASCQYRPDSPRNNEQGKARKYEAPAGRASVLDVHPMNAAKLTNPMVALWITEGVKKGDALTTAGECAISLSGVYNWRSNLGTLGDWEDVPLRGRTVFVCFDSDAATNRNVARAMRRLGAWLRSKGATARFVLPPDQFTLSGGKTGVDDFLARGGTVAELVASATTTPPDPDAGDASLSDSRLAERVADDVLAARFRFVQGLGWLEYEGTVWLSCGDERVVEAVREFCRELLVAAANAGADAEQLRRLASLQSASRIKGIAGLTRGMDVVTAVVTDFDADPWLLNCANGVVDLQTGCLLDHDPGLLLRHKSNVAFYADARHNDWDAALDALPDEATKAYVQVYLGTGATGRCPREDVLTIWHGGGSNGKSTLLGASQAALGSYARAVLPSVLGGRREEHPTELMDLLGVRMAYGEETAEGHVLDVVKMKRIIGTEKITARRMRQDPVEFTPTHTMIFSTNYRPVVPDSDHGTWRRLRMVPFPKTYGRDGQNLDTGLRQRVVHGREQQQAVLAWLVDGARRWYEAGLTLPTTPETITTATREWREVTDVIFAFANERLVAEANGTIDSEFLRREFNDWMPQPHREWGMQTFGERFANHDALRELGARRGRHPKNRRACFFGIALT
jgi:P4 family phage/plasmid primase-like protien